MDVSYYSPLLLLYNMPAGEVIIPGLSQAPETAFGKRSYGISDLARRATRRRKKNVCFEYNVDLVEV